MRLSDPGGEPVSHLAPRLRIVGAALLFSTGGAAIKACSLTSWQVAGLRSAVAALTVLAILPESRRRWSLKIVLVGACYAATMVLFVSANKLTTAASTIFLQSTAPIYVLLLSPWLLKEHLRARDLGFLAVMASGMACFFLGTPPAVASAPHPLEGNVLALFSGIFWGLTVVGMRWLGQRSESSDAAAMIIAGNVIAALACAPFAFPIVGARAVDWGVVLYLGVFQIATAYVWLTAAMRHVGALEASLLLFVEPVFNPVWAYLAQGERPGTLAIAGGVLILAATAWRTWSSRPRVSQP
ncbi:MAG: DMT family transporter [Acidobacteriota bacterium]